MEAEDYFYVQTDTKDTRQSPPLEGMSQQTNSFPTINATWLILQAEIRSSS